MISKTNRVFCVALSIRRKVRRKTNADWILTLNIASVVSLPLDSVIRLDLIEAGIYTLPEPLILQVIAEHVQARQTSFTRFWDSTVEIPYDYNPPLISPIRLSLTIFNDGVVPDSVDSVPDTICVAQICAINSAIDATAAVLTLTLLQPSAGTALSISIITDADDLVADLSVRNPLVVVDVLRPLINLDDGGRVINLAEGEGRNLIFRRAAAAGDADSGVDLIVSFASDDAVEGTDYSVSDEDGDGTFTAGTNGGTYRVFVADRQFSRHAFLDD